METRGKKYHVWLLGAGREESLATLTQLPTSGDVPGRYFNFVRKENMTVAEASNITAEEVIAVWEKAALPTSHKPKVVERVKGLAAEYAKVSRNRTRGGEAQLTREAAFEVKMRQLFDTVSQFHGPASIVRVKKITRRSCCWYQGQFPSNFCRIPGFESLGLPTGVWQEESP